MEKKAHYYLVGVFVTIAFISLIGFTIWLSSPRDAGNSDFYTVYFTDPISGLAEGTTVTYRGMDVGKVQNVRLDPSQVDLIKVDIVVNKSTPVRANTKAEISTQGITGLTQLDLTTNLNDIALPKNNRGEKYPVLRGSPSQLSRIMDSISKFTAEGSGAADSMHKLSDQLRANPSQIIFGAKKIGSDAKPLTGKTP